MYKDIASVYNALGWDKFSLKTADKLKPYLKKWRIKNHLDLACGTGLFVNELSRLGIDSSGLDISKEMIAEAKKRFPDRDFYIGDMTCFNFKNKFDLITCLYDSINHLTTFYKWKKVFQNVYKNLNRGGHFIFDFNTISKMNMARTTTYQTQPDYLLVVEHKPVGNDRREFFAEWCATSNKNYCVRKKFRVMEKSYPFSKIKELLAKTGFHEVSLLFTKTKNPDLAPRLFVSARKP